MNAEVVALRPDAGDIASVADRALSALHRYLDRCKLSANTAKAYKRQAATYVLWLTGPGIEHDDAFADVVGAEAAVTAWRRSRIEERAAPNTINQGIAALTLMYAQLGLRIRIKRATVPKPGEPDALTGAEQGAVERAAARRGARDAAIIAVLLYAGAREEECARLEADDIAITARTGTIRLHGKGDQVRTVPIPPTARARITAWLDIRGRQPGPLWTGQRGALTISGIVQVVLAVGTDAKHPGLRPHRLRHTYATRLREGGADVAQVQALLGHASLDTSARYFRAGTAEQAAVVDRVFD
ncbi:integrase/recombinase XerC [Nonomuraea fuscirosea]|uniref:Integrase/recombinase XerC n=1 Tax=Nonomuraea fuscirosea TaxID=1291556 RepID=A0A2T0LPP1_9ACTN|nr:tyrosine-type recombinase/integrase [Nonomuraea fuscirosea]PRX45318.1 integrase/recombinase XerC [Nonomuraea fuscirosea]